MALSKQQEFIIKWENKLATKKGNNVAMSLQKYKEIIVDLKAAKALTTKKSDYEYKITKRYEIVTIGETEFLVSKKNSAENLIYFVANEHIFEKIHEIHLNHGHGGVNKMMKHVKEKYENITVEAIKLYISLCDQCERRRDKVSRKSVIVKPIKSTDYNSRCQVDLVDMQSKPIRGYKWILNYQDHFTKFVHLRPLKSKEAIEVASTLVDIWLTNTGAPLILQSDRGGEFVNKTIKEVAKQWPGMKVIHGRSRYPQSQGSVECANKEISKMLNSWLTDNDSQDWVKGLSFVQFQKNSSHHASIRMSPCEALYGKKASRGLASTGLEPSTFHQFQTEDDLQEHCNSQVPSVAAEDEPLLDEGHVDDVPRSLPDEGQANDFADSLHSKGQDNDMLITHHQEVHMNEDQTIDLGEVSTLEYAPIYDDDIVICMCSICQQEVSPGNMVCCEQCSSVVHATCADAGICQRCTFTTTRGAKRKICGDGHVALGKKMCRDSDRRLPPLQIGDNVRVPVDKVDRGPLDPPNLIGVVTEHVHDKYRIGTSSGMLNQAFSRSQVEKCKNVFITPEDVPDPVHSVRSANAADSIIGGQGHDRCTCQQGCKDNRCKCKKRGFLCNSYCHKSSACKNKG